MPTRAPVHLTLVLQEGDLAGAFLTDVLRAQGFSVGIASPGAGPIGPGVRDDRAGREAGSDAVVLLEAPLLEEDGVATVRELLVRAPDARILVFAARGSAEAALVYLRAGASDYALRTVDDLATFLQRVKRLSTSPALPPQALASLDPATLPPGVREGMDALRERMAAALATGAPRR